MPETQIKFKFNKGYFFITILILVIEILIALFVHDTLARPYIGDLLVVILIYCCIRSFLISPVVKTCWAILAFAFSIEFLQYYNLASMLGAGNSVIGRTIIGTTFQWLDFVMYTLGILAVLLIEKGRRKLSRA